VLEKLFGTDVSPNVQAVQSEANITADAAVNYIGKQVTVCTKVYSVKTLAKVSFIDVGARFPNSPLTIVIFAKDIDKFEPSLEELYSGKNICVKGIVELYKSKPEIIVSDPGQITVK
jgi:DNA/RNA endonuclease YhcR with UshA esterase domain